MPTAGTPADRSVALRDAGGNVNSWEAGELRVGLRASRPGVTALLLGMKCEGQVLSAVRGGDSRFLGTCGPKQRRRVLVPWSSLRRSDPRAVV